MTSLDRFGGYFGVSLQAAQEIACRLLLLEVGAEAGDNFSVGVMLALCSDNTQGLSEELRLAELNRSTASS